MKKKNNKNIVFLWEKFVLLINKHLNIENINFFNAILKMTLTILEIVKIFISIIKIIINIVCFLFF